MTRGDTIQSMRRLADFLEFHSDIPLPDSFSGLLHISKPEEFRRAAKELLSHGGTVAVIDRFASVKLVVGPGVSLGIQTNVSTLLDDEPAHDQAQRVRDVLEG